MAYKVNEDYFKTWSHNMAYVFGLWCADGHIYAENNTYSFSIALKESDRYLLETIKKDLQFEAPLRKAETKSPRSESTSTIYKLTVGSKILVEDLLGLGGQQRKSLIMKLPVVPNQFFPDFIRGLFDGDGTIVYDSAARTWKAGIYSGTESFVKELQAVLTNRITDLSCPIQKARKLFCLTFSANNARRLAKFMYNSPSLLFLYRKYNRFLEMGSNLNLRSKGSYNNPALVGLTREDIILHLQNAGSIAELGKSLNVNNKTLYRYMKDLDIDWKKFISGKKVSRKRTKKEISEIESCITEEMLQHKLSNGESLRSLGEMFDVNKDIIKRRCEMFGIEWDMLGKDKKESFRHDRCRERRSNNGLLD
jgi:hypothetical protein